jgi:hypothetical protein
MLIPRMDMLENPAILCIRRDGYVLLTNTGNSLVSSLNKHLLPTQSHIYNLNSLLPHRKGITLSLSLSFSI